MTPFPAPDRWQAIEPLLKEALELPRERRAAFLEEACSGDPGLLAAVEELLRADSEAGAFLGAPVDLAALALPSDAEGGTTPDPAFVAGTAIGPYRLVREIGRGGMGVVYEALQQRPRRPVALKVILGGRHVDAEAVRMFQRETDSLARLKHPAIASIYESGCTDEGQHFFAMELVQGRTLSEHLDEAGVPASRDDQRRRLALFLEIGAAVAYAHQRGVIHRDLKPSNILVLPRPGSPGTRSGGATTTRDGPADETPAVKILDFGLARITDTDGERATEATAIGRIQGTLPYMSPEQVRGRRDEVDVRTDVYSLGVILYRMLAGRLPHDLGNAALPEAVRIICEQPPRSLSTAAAGRARIDRDLEIIALKALEKEPARRYPTVAALDEDIARYLAGQPILARPPSAAYQIGKLIARHKAPFAAAAVLLVAVVASAVGMTLQARRIAAERDRADREARTALRVSDFLTGLFKVSDPNEARGNAITAREILDKGVDRIGRDLADEPEVQAGLMLTLGKVYASLGLYDIGTPMLEQSVAMRRRLLGEENRDTLESMYSLAFQYMLRGRAAEAETLHARVLEIRTRLLGEDDMDTLQSMGGLASAYRYQGRYPEEEKLRDRIIAVERRTLGPEHPATLLSTCDLATTYWLMRRQKEAEALFVPVLGGQRRVLGGDHPETLKTMHMLANVEYNLGRFDESERLFREALEGERRVLGPDHPETASTTNDFATMYDVQGRYAEAEPLYKDAYERHRRVLGDDHLRTLQSKTNLANMASVQGRYAEAEAMLRDALARERRLLGEDHAETINTLYNLACLSARRGDKAAALDWLGQSVAHGWSHADQIAADEDLKPLRGDPGFEALIEKAVENASRQAPAVGQ